MKNLLTASLVCICTIMNAQIITEIMYNPPESGVDSLEYIEIYNNTDSIINFSDFTLIGVNMLFDLGPILAPDSFLLMCKNNSALLNNFGVNGIPWSSGALSNEGEELGIINAGGDTIFSMNYSSEAPWPTMANGGGASIELCDLSRDVNDPSNWNLSQTSSNITIENKLLLGTPGAANDAACTGTTSSSDFIEDSTIIIYPNPSHSELNIRNKDFVDKVQIYNRFGQLMLEENRQSTLQIDHFLSGHYYVKIYLEDGFITRTFTKI